MRILSVSPSFYPATRYGGPIFSTLAMCRELDAIPGVEVRVLTTDMAGARLSDRVKQLGTATGSYFSFPVFRYRRVILPDIAPGLFGSARKHFGWADVVWLTGVYNSPTPFCLALARALDKPVIWSMRGAIQATHEWGNARRPRTKRSFEQLCLLLRPRRLALHVTSEGEADACDVRMSGVRKILVPNGVDVPESVMRSGWRPLGVLRVAFLSRLDPKKGIENLIRAVPLLRVPVSVSIYGAGEDIYVSGLKALVATLGLNRIVTFHGHVDGAAREAAYAAADLFVLPSHTENFGMVVAEALARGVPCVVSQGAPWAALGRECAGAWVSNAPSSLAESINRAATWDLAAMGNNGREWMKREFSWASQAQKLKRAADELLES